MARTPKDYRSKRNPARTNEPFEPASSPAGTIHGAFVVHLHAARNTHYDLRIEMNGSLRSFAVPRGPCLNPDEKRLAVETEDHPLSYLEFEEIIPEGNYGAGSMIVWDVGRVRYLERTGEEGHQTGKVDFELWGHKLKGRFALVRTKGQRDSPQPQWLFWKKPDAFASKDKDILEENWSALSGLAVEELATRSAMAGELEATALQKGAKSVSEAGGAPIFPMLCSSDAPTKWKGDYVFELKLDGVRMVARKSQGRVQLHYRSGRNATHQYADIARAVLALPGDELLLDGEIVAYNERGHPDFERLSRRFAAQRPLDLIAARIHVPVQYLVFDLLRINGADVRQLGLLDRKALLGKLVRGRGFIRAVDHYVSDPAPLLDFCEREKLEGLIAKRSTSKYTAGPKRTLDWIKLKCTRDDDFVVVGFTRGTNHRARLGALELATYDAHDPTKLIYRGRVGSGLTDATVSELLSYFEGQTEPNKTLGEICDTGPGEPVSDSTVVKPSLVVSVNYLTWTKDGRLRMPVYRGTRPDIPPDACTAQPKAKHDTPEEPSEQPGATIGEGIAEDKRSNVVLTNTKKIFWPEEGFTKGDLIRYYEEIGPVMLPYLAGRPVVLVRYPDGIAGKSFYQWNAPQGLPSWVKTTQVNREDFTGKERHETPREVTGFLIDDLETLLYVANLGCIPLHILASRYRDAATLTAECDFFTIDLDPGPAPFSTIVELTLGTKLILDEIGLRGFAKTSGQKGMHILVPLGPNVTFTTAKRFCDLVGSLLVSRFARVATLARMKKDRDDRVYVDTGQTGPSRTIVAPYSVRAVAGATVSTPLDWDEISQALRPDAFSISTVPSRMATRNDPMGDLLSHAPDLGHAVAQIEALIRP